MDFCGGTPPSISYGFYVETVSPFVVKHVTPNTNLPVNRLLNVGGESV
jgi:hypothetical protein